MDVTYIFIDGAQLKDRLGKVKEINSNFKSFYKDQAEEYLADIGPYLFSYQTNNDFSKFYRNEGWGNAWGVIFKSNFPFEEVYKHFQKFLLVNTEDGQEPYFRFYDPRVLRIFLPTCDKHQILEFFGPVEYFITEAENKEEAIIFKHNNGELMQEKIPASKLFGELAENKSPENKELEVEPAQLSEAKKTTRRFIY